MPASGAYQNWTTSRETGPREQQDWGMRRGLGQAQGEWARSRGVRLGTELGVKDCSRWSRGTVLLKGQGQGNRRLYPSTGNGPGVHQDWGTTTGTGQEEKDWTKSREAGSREKENLGKSKESGPGTGELSLELVGFGGLG